MYFTCFYVKDGVIEKQFYREGKNVQAVKDEIDTFQWAELPEGGEWVIAPAPDDSGGPDFGSTMT